MNDYYRLLATIAGALFGSFLNVVIHRLPLKEDLVLARSACPHCQAPIPFYLNIPLISFLVLRGKCRSCHAPISWRYPLVEVFMAFVAWASFPTDPSNAMELFEWGYRFAICSILVCHFFIDLRHRLLLDVLNIYLLIFILPYALLFSPTLHWLMGGLFGFGGPFAVSWVFYKIKGKVGLGGGDIKLWGVLGIFLGVHGVMENIFLSCLVGSLVGIGLIMFKRYDRDNGIPFGPYIIAVAITQLYFPGLPARLGFALF